MLVCVALEIEFVGGGDAGVLLIEMIMNLSVVKISQSYRGMLF